MKYEAMEEIRDKIKGFNMANNMININIDIPADKKEIVTAFKGLINAFKSDIKVKEVENIEISSQNKNLSREERLKKYTNSGLVALRDEELKEARFLKYAK